MSILQKLCPRRTCLLVGFFALLYAFIFVCGLTKFEKTVSIDKTNLKSLDLQNCTTVKEAKDHFGSSRFETLDFSLSSWESVEQIAIGDVLIHKWSQLSFPDLSTISHTVFVCWRNCLNYMHLYDYEPHILLGLLAFAIAVWYWYFTTEIKPERSPQSGIDISPTSHMTIFMQMKRENLMMKHLLEEASITIGSLQGQIKMLEDENMELLCSCPKTSRPSPRLISTGKYPKKYAPRTKKHSRRS